jgi:hypothetical protein
MKTKEKLSKKNIIKLNNAMIEGVTDSILYELTNTCTVKEMADIFKYLLQWYEESPELFTEFVNHKSDAVSEDACSIEKIEKDFHEFIIIKQS